MKKKHLPLMIISFLFVLSCATNTNESNNSNLQQVFTSKVIIDYGGEKQLKETDVKATRQLSALEALQYASIVETHPVGEHVFVSSIDNVSSIRGVKAWYYKVNGESPGILAINNKINSGDTLRWIYKADVCSPTVDNK